MDGLEISTDKLELAAPDRGILSLSNFHKVSRAEGPKRTDGMSFLAKAAAFAEATE